jgi:DNA polymerase alpha-associated DNA helicase A
MADTMALLKDTPMENLSTLSRILLGQTAPTKVTDLVDLKFFDETLNESQKEAVRFSLSAPEIALIHGPPGVRH